MSPLTAFRAPRIYSELTVKPAVSTRARSEGQHCPPRAPLRTERQVHPGRGRHLSLQRGRARGGAGAQLVARGSHPAVSLCIWCCRTLRPQTLCQRKPCIPVPAKRWEEGGPDPLSTPEATPSLRCTEQGLRNRHGVPRLRQDAAPCPEGSPTSCSLSSAHPTPAPVQAGDLGWAEGPTWPSSILSAAGALSGSEADDREE